MPRTKSARRSSRIRLGIEMLSQNPDPKYKAGLEQDIAELDALVDDILLASRLDMNKTLQQREPVDLLALAAEEGARYDDCNVEGEAGHRQCRSAAACAT